MTIVTVIGLVSCSDSSEITVYSIPKEQVGSTSGKEQAGSAQLDQTGSALEKYLTKTTIGDLPAHLVQAENAGKSVRVFVLKFEEKTWFFKLMGNTDLAIKEQENFDKFVQAIDVKSGQGQDKWFIPEGWEPGKKSSMRIGSFAVKEGNDSSLDISVTAFPGDLGGLLPNVERWLGQIGLDPSKNFK